ncbi:MAG: segregation/condensation protein A [Candidatus Atribacteria bacterium]
MNNIDTNFKIKFDNFEGSVNELIKNIRENTIDINQVPIVDILSQYSKYLLESKNIIDLNVASKIITDTAIVLKIKSEHLLPNIENKNREGEDEEDNNSIISGDKNDYLQEYNKYQKVVKYLKEREGNQSNIYFPMIRNKSEEDNIEIQEVDLADLLTALEKVLLNKKKEEFLPVKKTSFTVITKMKEIIDLLRNNKSGISFNYFIEITQSKLEIIVTFLALLELIYLKKINCYQNKNFGKIIFCMKGDALNSKKN